MGSQLKKTCQPRHVKVVNAAQGPKLGGISKNIRREQNYLAREDLSKNSSKAI
jgi:hypothetical protein